MRAGKPKRWRILSTCSIVWRRSCFQLLRSSCWQAWIAGLNGPVRVPARKPGDGRLEVIDDAPGRYASVRRYVRRVRGGLTPEPSGIIETGPGEEAQVDCGEGPMVRDPSRSLDSFDFTFTKKMNRALVFELGTEAGRADGRHAR